MRIVVDLQAAQTGSRFRGIGHYATELVKGLIRSSPDDEFVLALNGLFPESIEPIRAEFDALVPQHNIRVWNTPGPIETFGPEPGNLREAGEAMREYFLRSLDPDLILVTSAFEGQSDGAIVSVKKFVTDVPVAAIFYDLTPLYMPDEQFRTNPTMRRWYRYRIEQLRKCDLLLAISESSRQEAIDKLGFDPSAVVNVFGGRNDNFAVRDYAPGEKAALLRNFGITKPFILYSGGIEANKNLKSLIAALADLPVGIQRDYQVVCVGKRNPGEVEQIRSYARSDTTREMIKFTDFVSQDDLVDLYNCCDLFVFPSFREGFGLPPLEAMSCGAPTIVSDRTSLPEVVDNPDALFDPSSSQSIARKISQVLGDDRLRRSLVRKGLERAASLTWDRSGALAIEAISDRFGATRHADAARRTVVSQTGLFKPNRKRILAQKLDHNGDFLLAVPALARLRARYPDARIDALVGSWNRLAAEATGLFDEVHTLDYFKAKSSVRASLDSEELESLLQRLPYYDYAIDFRRQSETRFLIYEIGAGQYFGYRTPDGKNDDLLTDPLEIHPDAGGERGYFDETHTTEQMLRIVDSLPFDANDYLRLPDIGERRPVERGSIAIFPRVGNDSRQWDSEYFGRLIDGLTAEKTVTQINLYVGAKDDLDVIPYRRHDKVKIHAGLDFPTLFSSLSANQVCVGNNSFGVHLASYAGCQTIGIYSGHELQSQWGPPFGDSVVVSVDAACAPCHLPDRPSCPFDLFCLNDISVQTVRTLVLDAVDGKAIAEAYSPVHRRNPASAIKPLVDALNRNKLLGRSGDLTEQQRVALAAAIALNFPERSSAERHVYVDVTGLLSSSSGRPKTGAAMRRVRDMLAEIADGADRAARVIPIATGPHDHEFYQVDLNDLELSLYGGDRSDRIVFPLAGDTYIGPDPYFSRNPAQWNLQIGWRQAGVTMAFQAPEEIYRASDEEIDGEGEDENGRLSSYLFFVGHFDILVAPSAHHERLKRLIADYGPERLRPIELREEFALLGRREEPSPFTQSSRPAARRRRLAEPRPSRGTKIEETANDRR